MPSADPFSPRDLFGGAIVAELPTSWKDVSDFRQVPDNQEVFISPDTDAQGERSLILEVLQSVDRTDLGEAVRFHFDSIAHDNSATASTITSVYTLPSSSTSSSSSSPSPSPSSATAPPTASTPPPQTPTPILLRGTQHVSKFGRTSSSSQPVQIYVALWRIVSKGVDLVLSLNAAGREADVVQGTQEGGRGGGGGEARRVFERAASTLQIRDLGLFA